MTLNELKNEVLSLGFETRIERIGNFYIAAKQALKIIFSERRMIKTAKLYCAAPKVLTRVKKLTYSGKGEQIIPLPGHSYSFYVSGKGSYTVIDGNESYTESFDADSRRMLGRMKKGGEIRFHEGDYTVFDLVSYENSYEGADIPEAGERRVVRLEGVISGFSAFASMPRGGDGKPINGAVFIGRVLLIPFDYEGEISFEYTCNPRPIDPDAPDTSLDVPAECEHLLPLLCAAYLWLDDDPEKAQYYLMLYKDGMSDLRRFTPCSVNNVYSSNGWA